MGILGYESDFSPDGRRFAILDGDDGKLRIWDTKEDRLEQDYVPNAHLSGPYTCLVWCQICTGNVSEACNGQNLSLYLALGTSRGGVDLYSHATGKLDRKLRGIQTKQDKSSDGIVHAGPVTCICLHSNNSTLYTAGEDCQIFEWSLKECSAVRSFSIGKNTPTRIVSLPLSNTLLVGCKTLHQWSLDGRKPKLMATLTGHSADVSSMKEFHFADTREEYVATTAKNNREIYLWKIGSQSSKGTFLMEHAGSVASCSVTDGKLIIAAITRGAGGKVHLFVVEDISDIGKKPRHPKVTLSVALDSGKEIAPYPIEAATTNFSKAHSSSILIGYGKPSGLSFVDKLYNLNDKVQVVEPKQPKNQVNRQEKNNEMFKTYVPGDGVIPHIPGETPRPPRKTPGDTPISKHLELLDSTVETDDAKGYSLVETLKQALNNHDATNIRIVLATKDENVIRSTLKRLPAKYVPSLIDQLTLLTHKKTANVQVAVRWLKLLLQIHASQLMALGKDELHHRFGALLGIIDHRTQALSKLSKLSGRLDFLLNQIKRNTDDDLQLTHENLLVYEDDVEASSDVNTKSDDEGGNTTDEDTVDLENGQDESMDDEDENFVDTTDGSSN